MYFLIVDLFSLTVFVFGKQFIFYRFTICLYVFTYYLINGLFDPKRLTFASSQNSSCNWFVAKIVDFLGWGLDFALPKSRVGVAER